MNRKTLVETAVVASLLSAAGVSSAGQAAHKEKPDASSSRVMHEKEIVAALVGSPAEASNDADVERQVNDLIARYGRHRVEPIAAGRPLADLGVDILALVNIVIHVESRYRLQLNPDEILSWVTPADIVETVEKALTPSQPDRYE